MKCIWLYACIHIISLLQAVSARKMTMTTNCSRASSPQFFFDNALVPALGVEYYSAFIPPEIRSRYNPFLLRCKEALVAVLSLPEEQFSRRPALADSVQVMAADESAPHFFGTLMMAALAGETRIFENYYESARADMCSKWTNMQLISQKAFVALFGIGFGFTDIPFWVDQIDILNDRQRLEPLPDLLLGHTRALIRAIRRATVEEVNV
jgi:hypothetical protein